MTASTDVRTQVDELSAVRTALLTAARKYAAAVLAAADESAEATLAAAHAEAAEIRTQARARGAADARTVLEAERARTRRRARSMVLAAQGDCYQNLRRAVRAAVAELRSDPSYPALLERLRRRAREDLGATATLREDPAGGLVAATDGWRSTYLLTDLADEAVARMGSQVEGLWAP